MNRILVVDDQEENLSSLTSLLNKYGYEIETAQHGVEAIAKASNRLPDLIISDLLMPEMDGYNLLRHWKFDSRFLKIPFVVYTATYTDSTDELFALNLGADAFISKPAEEEKLIAVLREVEKDYPTKLPVLQSSNDSETENLLRLYSENLIRKLEQKSIQLEESNRALEKQISDRIFAEQAHNRLFNYSLDLLCVGDFEWKLEQVNPAWTRSLGWSAEELTSKSCIEFVHPDDLTSTLDVCESLTSGREVREFENRYRCSDGSYRWLSWNIYPLVESCKMFSVVRDITDRRTPDETFRASEVEMRTLTEALPQIVWITNPDGRCIHFNQKWVEHTGLSLSESLGDKWLQALHVDDQPNVAAVWLHSTASGEPYEVQYRLQNASGKFHWVLARGLPLRDQSGKVIKWIGTLTDIHDLKEAQERIGEQASLLDSATDAIFVRDINNNITSWNRSAELLYGWKAEEVIGRSLKEIFYLNRLQNFESNMNQLMLAGEWSGELNKSSKDGRAILVQARWTLLRDEQGHPKSILSIDTDITEKKKLEERSIRTQRLESIGTLAGGIAHDLNNVLAPIVMSLATLREVSHDSFATELIDTLEVSAQRGTAMVKQVLAFARGVEGKRMNLDPAKLILEVHKVVKDTFPKSVAFDLAVKDDLWNILGDTTQLHQVFLNLCVNARDAMPSGGKLQISMANLFVDEAELRVNPETPPGPYVLVEVTDTGIGIPKEIQGRVFEPFFTTKDLESGTGLGLSTTLAIVKSHGGYINFYSEIGKGTKFKVFLPASVDRAGIEASKSKLSILPRGNGELILLVDDESSIRKVAKSTLEHFGYKVIVASSGSEAAILYTEKRDLIKAVITDMSMPEMDGSSLITSLRKINSKLPFIATSGLASNAEIVSTLSVGEVPFIAKPFTAEILLNTLKAVLNKKEK